MQMIESAKVIPLVRLLLMNNKYADAIVSNVQELVDAHTVDAVAVVRCRDCESFADVKGKDSGKPCGYGQCKWPTGIRGIVCADDFCSFGKRKDG